MKKYITWSIFGVAGAILAVGVMLFHYLILPLAIQYQVRKTLALEPGTESWERFEVTPIALILKIYFFTVDNPEEVLKGVKPKVREIGPYIFQEHWKKHDIRIDEERDSIFYRQGIDFVFDQEASGALSENDNVTITNGIIPVIASVINSMPLLNIAEEIIEFGLPELLGEENYGPLMTFKVKDILFDGIKVPCSRKDLSFYAEVFCSALKRIQPTKILSLDNEGNIIICLLGFKKMGPLYEIERGNKNPDSMGKIISVDGKTKTDSWRCDKANTVNGYDMVMLPSFLDKSSVVTIYTSELETSVDAIYKDDTSFAGIGGYRFGLTWSMLDNPKTNPEAACYCPGSVKGLTIPNPCWEGNGVLDLSSPIGIPALLSLPHFYNASDKYRYSVEGLHPNPDIHESFLDIEPYTGVPLRGFKRIQANIVTHKIPGAQKFKNHSEALIPIIWFEEGTSLGEAQISLLRDQLLTVLRIESIVKWTLFAVGLTILVIGTTMAIIRKKQHVPANETTFEIDD